MPEPDINDEMTLVGKKGQIESMVMSRDTEPTVWLPVKYGKPWVPYKCTVIMSNVSSGDNGQWKAATPENRIEYEYQMKNRIKNVNNTEREPKRLFTILNPELYKGQLGATGNNLWASTEEVFVVNGFVNKADGNFELDFRIQRIEESGITIGSFPGNDKDISQVKNAGCNSVIDL
jgi:hypothetical protein